jgi:hypothetical protein
MRFFCVDSFKAYVSSAETKLHRLLDADCESLLDRHCTLLEALDFTLHFVDDLA